MVDRAPVRLTELMSGMYSCGMTPGASFVVVVVAVLVNEKKQPLFSVEERIQAIRAEEELWQEDDGVEGLLDSPVYDEWASQWLPTGLIYHPYWAGPQASTDTVMPDINTWTQCVAVDPTGQQVGDTVQVPTLNGRKKLRVPPGTKHGTVQRLRGEGPPKLGAKGRGDIHYRFVLDVPDELSREQEKAIEELSKVMNGNPRARLFA